MKKERVSKLSAENNKLTTENKQLKETFHKDKETIDLRKNDNLFFVVTVIVLNPSSFQS